MKGYDKLRNTQKDLFEKTYKVHTSDMNEEWKQKHAGENFIEIKWENEENRLVESPLKKLFKGL